MSNAERIFERHCDRLAKEILLGTDREYIIREFAAAASRFLEAVKREEFRR